ncbi:DUF6185 family protein [Streptomyces sp. ET3-23]|uniref:DUF6185 family protein n=1 Tax=Streptomyces sp. ET3-23 TaxID=2885643 RepID=UPI001D102626|nr:DUF6185 family protein [Streptomyces sp. ET3-23]MCC2274012.1 DUF6185 family protein [Streptomyces sp. ET3-23]
MRQDARDTAHWWRQCAALLLAGLVVWWGACPARADSATASSCRAEQLASARTQAELRIINHGHAVVEASGTMNIRVPAAWPYANDLLLKEDSDAYRHAMGCLLRGPQPGLRRDEWRPHSPRVTEEASWVAVRYDTLFWFKQPGTSAVGPWTIDVRTGKWTMALAPSPALMSSHWDHVEIDLDGLDASGVSPRPSTAGNGRLVWTGLGPLTGAGHMVTVQVAPPWQRAWTAKIGKFTAPWLVASAAGETTWWLGTSAVIVLAALRARRQPAGDGITEQEKNSSTSLLQWGLLKATMGISILLLYRAVLYVATEAGGTQHWLGDAARWQTLIGFLVGWGLVASARPPRSVLVMCSLVAVAGGLAAAVPSLFGLPSSFTPLKNLSAADIAVLTLMSAALLWLWLTGLLLWARSLARAGGLLRLSAAPWRPSRIGAWTAVVALLFTGWATWADERHWQRISWLTDRSAAGYRPQYLVSLGQDLVSFSAQVPTWCYSSLAWVLTGVGIVALLRARELGRDVPCASPGRLDCLLLAVFFAIVVAWRQGSYAGSQVLASLWLALDIVALYGLLAVGQRRSVLTQHFEGYEGAPALGETITETARHDLIARARRYRELVGLLRGLEQGHGEGGLSRHALEKELSGLHRWRPAAGAAGAVRPSLPGSITVVDVALSWGPHAKWWDNSRRAALLAAAFGVPGSLLFVWLTYSPEHQWMRTGQYYFGAPEVVWTFVSWELTWAGAGLVLGALWRLLPGRRGPSRALSLVIAYALLIGLGSVGNLITDQEVGTAIFGIFVMLLVLTFTGLAMDADTFRSERRFWPNRVGLLLSVYQMRSFSAQIAYVLVQLVAVLTVLRYFTESGSRLKP